MKYFAENDGGFERLKIYRAPVCAAASEKIPKGELVLVSTCRNLKVSLAAPPDSAIGLGSVKIVATSEILWVYVTNDASLNKPTIDSTSFAAPFWCGETTREAKTANMELKWAVIKPDLNSDTYSDVSLRAPYLSNTKVLEPGDRLLRAHSQKSEFPGKRSGPTPETADAKRAKAS